MTPKEKALELRQIMFSFIPIKNNIEESILSAKHCAKMAVIEILKVTSTGSYNESYFEEVKQEIEKL